MDPNNSPCKPWLMPPVATKTDRKRLQKSLDICKANLEKARSNLILLDASNLPAAQERIRQLEQEKVEAEQELQKSEPLPEKDVNEITLHMLDNLYWLARCCRDLARRNTKKWAYYSSAKLRAPKDIKWFLNHANISIICHTQRKGSGNGTRHPFKSGEIVFNGQQWPDAHRSSAS
jgi:hypothetical protein